MQQNFFNPYLFPASAQAPNPNAVNINIFSPAAYSGVPPMNSQPSAYPNGFYSMYGTNMMPGMPQYPQNYNNMIQQMPTNNMNVVNNGMQSVPQGLNGTDKAQNSDNKDSKTDKEEKKKQITPLTDEYVKNLENYLNNNNPKVRLIGAKELIERFKEDENRKDNPSLIPLLNKSLRDTSPSIRFLALTALQLGYSVGNDETVQILKQIQQANKDGYGEDALLASEILLKLSAPQSVEVKEGK